MGKNHMEYARLEARIKLLEKKLEKLERQEKRKTRPQRHYRKNKRVVYVRKSVDIDKVLNALRTSPDEPLSRVVERAIIIAGKHLNLVKKKNSEEGALQKFLQVRA